MVVILVIAGAVFALARRAACFAAMSDGEFRGRRNLWFGVTLAAFLAHNFWLFALLATWLLVYAAGRDRNPLAMALFVLLAIPDFSERIPGLGLINFLFDLSFPRLISLVVFLPLLVRDLGSRPVTTLADGLPVRLLLAYLALNLMLLFPVTSATGTLRTAFYYCVDVLIPFLVASRCARDLGTLRSVLACYVAGAAVLAAIGCFEVTKGWLLYSSLDEALGAPWVYGGYLMRDGMLRAMTTAGQAIPYGYVMGIGVILLACLRRSLPSRQYWYAGLCLLAFGLLASFSRGPWIGTLCGVLVLMVAGQGGGRRLSVAIGAGGILALAFLLMPGGESLVRPLTLDEGSYAYRQQVLEASVSKILENPWFGSRHFLASEEFEALRQGQGIIDIVNTYAGVGLYSGLVGLALFVGFFAAAVRGVWRRMRAAEGEGGETESIGRGLLAAIVCIMVTIGTVSSVTFVPLMYYLIAGFAVAYSRLEAAAPETDARKSACRGVTIPVLSR